MRSPVNLVPSNCIGLWKKNNCWRQIYIHIWFSIFWNKMFRKLSMAKISKPCPDLMKNAIYLLPEGYYLPLLWYYKPMYWSNCTSPVITCWLVGQLTNEMPMHSSRSCSYNFFQGNIWLLAFIFLFYDSHCLPGRIYDSPSVRLSVCTYVLK